MRFIAFKSTLVSLKVIFFVAILMLPMSGNTESDKLDLFATFENLCEEKDYTACYALGSIYYYGAETFKQKIHDGLVKEHNKSLCSGQLIPDTRLSFSSVTAGANPSLN